MVEKFGKFGESSVICQTLTSQILADKWQLFCLLQVFCPLAYEMAHIDMHIDSPYVFGLLMHIRSPHTHNGLPIRCAQEYLDLPICVFVAHLALECMRPPYISITGVQAPK